MKQQKLTMTEFLNRKNLLSNQEAALYLGITPRTLEVWRCTKRYIIPYIKVGRLVKYRPCDLDVFLEERLIID